ncbi:hypothetical protein ACQVTU_32380 [Bacillus cereus]|uniref:hypothetical protein n=1 Tax=Bacillus cereus TaxID=1396 RepID=UPI003D66075E
MGQACFFTSTQLLRDIDQQIGTIESMLLKTSVLLGLEEKYKIHLMFLEIEQMLIELQRDPNMTLLAEGLYLQLQNIQNQYNRWWSKDKKH